MAGASGSAGTAGAGGSSGCPTQTPLTLFDFTGTSTANWSINASPNASPLNTSPITHNATEGSAAAGALQLEARLNAFSQSILLWRNYGNPGTDWTCRTRVRAMVKLSSATDLSHLAGINFAMNSNAYGTFSNVFLSASGFQNNVWREVVLTFASVGTPPLLTNVNQLGIQLIAQASGTTPVTTYAYMDDIILE